MKRNPSARSTENYRSDGRKDYQLVTCPQSSDICGADTVFSWIGINETNTFSTISLNLLTRNEKCSYLIKTTDGAPGFQII